MKKILVLTCITLLIAACGQENPEPQDQPTDINPQEEVTSEPSEEEITEEAEAERQIIESDISLFEEVDQADQTLEGCNDFQDPSVQASCKDQVILNDALEKRDATQCANISSEDLKEICDRESTQF